MSFRVRHAIARATVDNLVGSFGRPTLKTYAVVSAASALVVWGPTPVAAGGCAADWDHVTDFANSTSILVVSTLLVLFGVAVEKGQELLKEHTSRHMQPLLHSLFTELTLLGVIGLALFLFESSALLNILSKWLYSSEGFLLHVFHEVHMVLFLVMMLFLSSVLFLVKLAHGIEHEWNKFETLSTDRKSILVAAAGAEFAGKGSIMSRILGRSPAQRAFELVLYASFRSRFIDPTESDHVMDDDVPEPSAPGEPIEMVLGPTTAELYQKRFTVYAFQTEDPIHVSKHWGESKGTRGDWMIVGLENDIYCCPDEEFRRNYVPVKGKKDHYRKQGMVFARRMDIPFVAKSDKGLQRGAAGSYLLQVNSKEHPQYSVTEEEFTKTYERSKTGSSEGDGSGMKLRADFDFCQYLNILMGHTLAEIVEVTHWTWLVMWCIICLFWLDFNISESFIGDNTVFFKIVAVASGYITLIICWQALKRTDNIRRQLMSPELLVAAKTLAKKLRDNPPSNKVAPGTKYMDELRKLDLTHKEMPTGKDRSPPFLARKLVARKAGCCVGMRGRPANRHEQLFWFDHHGPHFLLNLVQVMLLLMALYIASCAVMFTKKVCADPMWCIILIIALLIPPVLLFFMLPRLIYHVVLVSNVETMKKRYVIMEVVRQQKATRSMRALRLLTAMKFYAKQHADKTPTGAGATGEAKDMPHPGSSSHKLAPIAHKSSESKPDGAHTAVTLHHNSSIAETFKGAAARVYGGEFSAQYRKRRAELLEAFALFDRDGAGNVSTQNMHSVLELVGMSDKSDDVAELIIAEIDTDSTGTIEFQEFFDWMASKEGSARQKADELTDFIFNVIDRDGSKTVTTAELRSTLTSLGEVMSVDDVQHLVREADENNDGVIDIHEFAELMRRSFEHSEFSL